MLYFIQEVRIIKNITLRVDDDFHYSAKQYALKNQMTLQEYMVKTVRADLEAKNAFVKSPIAKLIDELSDEELRELANRIKEKDNDKK